METEESRIYNAAHLMVASLAGSLAHVTCKVSSSSLLLRVLLVYKFVKIELYG